ncbi:MAG: hypothetical protein KDI19_07480, partial [Pseudomonadales bacterium]|nr:hypothetical protein [Pseudomonadales bacterium]
MVDHLKTFLQSVPEPVASYSASGNLLAANDAWRALIETELGPGQQDTFEHLSTRIAANAVPGGFTHTP